MEGVKQMEGKKVFVILKNNRQYSGVINDVHDSGGGLIFVNLTDKFGKLIIFSLSDLL